MLFIPYHKYEMQTYLNLEEVKHRIKRATEQAKRSPLEFMSTPNKLYRSVIDDCGFTLYRETKAFRADIASTPVKCRLTQRRNGICIRVTIFPGISALIGALFILLPLLAIGIYCLWQVLLSRGGMFYFLPILGFIAVYISFYSETWRLKNHSKAFLISLLDADVILPEQ